MNRALRHVLLFTMVASCDASRSRAPDARDTATSAREPSNADSSGEIRTAADTMPDSVAAIVKDYYAAINAHAYARAHAAWGDDGPPGHPTLRAFSDGFACTDSVHLELGQPGRIEGAAGSRYLTVPVTLRSFERSTTPTTYRGTYTLRRTVVEGASESSQTWHLYRGELRLVTGARNARRATPEKRCG